MSEGMWRMWSVFVVMFVLCFSLGGLTAPGPDPSFLKFTVRCGDVYLVIWGYFIIIIIVVIIFEFLFLLLPLRVGD